MTTLLNLIKEQAELHRLGYLAVKAIFDTQRHHYYLLVQVGWANCHWVDDCLLYLDIIDTDLKQRLVLP